ncbi:hypothetical protein GCM10010129_83480 [Streptomyces fumigatiscleroticus]|nr:hypothetical protein GCM10010129_83480 [Streptomyces fumigatiscleroticus]
MTARLQAERETWSRLRVTRETVAQVAAELSARNTARQPVAEEPEASAPTRTAGTIMVPHWREGLPVDVLPDVYRDIVEVAADASGPMQAKQIAPRIGLPAAPAKIEGTRGKLKRLLERGWLPEEPARWGPWAVPCPISDDEIHKAKEPKRRKARMDQRTRERLPVLPILVSTADRRRRTAADLLQAARNTEPGAVIPGTDPALRRALAPKAAGHLIWAEETYGGRRRNLDLRRRGRILGLCRDRGLASDRCPQRGAPGTDAPRHHPVPAPVHRRGGPIATNRSVQDRH